jgi:hypothetical protein
MKTITAILLILCVTNAYAQFTSASITDFGHGVANISTYQPRTTGNDVLEFNGDIYCVSVWENTSNTSDNLFGWSVNGSMGTTTFTHDNEVRDPDVCLVNYQNAVYAIVAYYSFIGRHYWQAFQWNGFTFASVANAQAFFTGGFGTTVNIDANDHNDGQFCILWDDPHGDVYAVVGDIASFTLNSNVLVYSGTGTSPDVSLYYDGSNNIAHITYIDGMGDLIVDDHSYATLAAGSAGSLSNVLTVSPQSGLNFYYPRIASPNGNNSSTNDWTVVAEETNHSGTYYIVGFNNGSTTPIIYNDGTYISPPTDLSNTPNYYPSVTYDSNFPTDGIWVGWTYSDGLNTDKPIALKCDNTAIPVISSYWEAPLNFTTNDYAINMSMAGRYASDELFLTFIAYIINGTTIDDIYIKNITGAGSTSSFKFSIPFIGQEIKDTDDKFHLKLIDINGKMVMSYFGNMNEIYDYLNQYHRNVSPSIYFAQFISEDGRIMKTQKFFIGN